MLHGLRREPEHRFGRAEIVARMRLERQDRAGARRPVRLLCGRPRSDADDPRCRPSKLPIATTAPRSAGGTGSRSLTIRKVRAWGLEEPSAGAATLSKSERTGQALGRPPRPTASQTSPSSTALPSQMHSKNSRARRREWTSSTTSAWAVTTSPIWTGREELDRLGKVNGARSGKLRAENAETRLTVNMPSGDLLPDRLPPSTEARRRGSGRCRRHRRRSRRDRFPTRCRTRLALCPMDRSSKNRGRLRNAHRVRFVRHAPAVRQSL